MGGAENERMMGGAENEQKPVKEKGERIQKNLKEGIDVQKEREDEGVHNQNI